MLTDCPIIPCLDVKPSPAERSSAERLAELLLDERPELDPRGPLQRFAVRSLKDAASLHLDDLSEIPLLDGGREVRFMQDRARLRAGEGDFVASVAHEVPGYEAYCRERLHMGSVEWLHPATLQNPLRIAQACWADRGVRRRLLRALRAGELRYLHPHMGTVGVWELARLLHERSRQPVQVIAPQPALSRFANDKVAFTELIRRLFGDGFVPATLAAWNLGTLVQRVSELAARTEMIGLKLPDSAGGDAIALLESHRVYGRGLSEVREVLVELLPILHWNGHGPLLIDAWESDVVCSPSVQLWIPPEADGLPVVEGIYVQMLERRPAIFVGAVVARLPENVTDELATRCWLLARVYQRLGYVGRCSFDAILVGESLASAQLKFIECNGRWGGTSLPMTLLNRLLPPCQSRPHAVHVLHVPGLGGLSFETLLDAVSDDLYDARANRGRVMFYNAGRLQYQSGITAVAVGDTVDDVENYILRELPAKLLSIVDERVVGTNTD